MVQQNERNYKAQDALGLALCGLTLCGDGDRLPEAITALRLARLINSDVAYVRRIVRMLEAMRPIDKHGKLVPACEVCRQSIAV
ncbi:MAG: hypothetical protein H7062_24755 [Candidatus Saccharimonas sp.]|nr:hypothetical protein [Planctomycetaceae bacterium]